MYIPAGILLALYGPLEVSCPSWWWHILYFLFLLVSQLRNYVFAKENYKYATQKLQHWLVGLFSLLCYMSVLTSLCVSLL